MVNNIYFLHKSVPRDEAILKGKYAYPIIRRQLTSTVSKIAYMKTTGDLIRQLRKTAKITQKQLAIALGITREAVSLWETGSTKPSGESLVALARYFGRNESEFLEEDQINNIDRIISINPNEKLYEFGTENEKLFKAKEPTADYNISKPMKYVPLLISEQVAQWMESKNKTDITGISQWQATTAQTGNNSILQARHPFHLCRRLS
jgi:transcriptional regulator with XRE-family HTH domain